MLRSLAEVGASGDFAQSPSGWFLSAITVLILGLVGWIARTLVKVNTQLDRVNRVLFPENRDPLNEQLETVRDDVRDLRIQGSNRLKEIVEETRLQRIDNAMERARLVEERRRGMANGDHPPIPG